MGFLSTHLNTLFPSTDHSLKSWCTEAHCFICVGDYSGKGFKRYAIMNIPLNVSTLFLTEHTVLLLRVMSLTLFYTGRLSTTGRSILRHTPAHLLYQTAVIRT